MDRLSQSANRVGPMGPDCGAFRRRQPGGHQFSESRIAEYCAAQNRAIGARLVRKELADGVGISGLQTAYDGTRLAIADCAIVKLAHRRHLGCGAGHECLIGYIGRIAWEKLLGHVDASIAHDSDYGRPRYARQTRGYRRCAHFAVADNKEIFPAAFCHVPVDVQQQCFIVTVAAGLIAGEDRIDIRS